MNWQIFCLFIFQNKSNDNICTVFLEEYVQMFLSGFYDSFNDNF